MNRGPVHLWLVVLLVLQQVIGLAMVRVSPACPMTAGEGACPWMSEMSGPLKPLAEEAAREGVPSCCQGDSHGAPASGGPVDESGDEPRDGSGERCRDLRGHVGLAFDGSGPCAPCCRVVQGGGAPVVVEREAPKAPEPAADDSSPVIRSLAFRLPVVVRPVDLRVHAPSGPAFVEARARRATLGVRTI